MTRVCLHLFCQLDKVVEKLLEFAPAAAAADPACALSEAESGTVLPELVAVLNDSTRYHASRVPKPAVVVCVAV